MWISYPEAGVAANTFMTWHFLPFLAINRCCCPRGGGSKIWLSFLENSGCCWIRWCLVSSFEARIVCQEWLAIVNSQPFFFFSKFQAASAITTYFQAVSTQLAWAKTGWKGGGIGSLCTEHKSLGWHSLEWRCQWPRKSCLQPQILRVTSLRIQKSIFFKKSVQEETDCLIKVLFIAPTFGAEHSGGASK